MRTLSLVLLCAACAANNRFVPPSRGGPAWIELSSEHFVLRTDLPESVARQRFAELESVRAGLVTVWPAKPPPGQTFVFAPATALEMEEFSFDKLDRDLGFHYTSWYGDRSVVVCGDHPWLADMSVTDSLAWSMLHANLRRAPAWITFGLTSYLEVVQVRADAVAIGASNPFHAYTLKMGPPGDAEWTVAWKLNGPRPPNASATSWLLVHHLMSTRLEAFRDYLRRLSAGEEPEAAWRSAFGTLRPQELNAALKQEIAGGRIEVVKLPFTPPPAPGIAVRALPEAELRALRAEVRVQSPVDFNDAAILDEGNAGLAADPANPAAIPFAVLNAKERIERARQAVAAHADDWRAHVLLWASKFQMASDLFQHSAPPAWLLVGRYVMHPVVDAELESELHVAARLVPENAVVAEALAAAYDARGQYTAALTPAETALRSSPGNIFALMVYADSLAGVGRCGEAGRFARLARARFDEVERKSGPIYYGRVFTSGQADVEEALDQRVQAYRGACSPLGH